MIRILIFGKNECARCKATKHKVTHIVSTLEPGQVEMLFHDQEDPDGRAEGAFYDVNPGKLPLTVMEKDGREAARWEGDVPDSQALRLLLEEVAHVAVH